MKAIVTASSLALALGALPAAAQNLGGTFTVKMPNAARGVQITPVYASHANNVALPLVSEPVRSQLAADDFSLTLRPPRGDLAISGRTMELDGKGKCVSGCS